MNRYINIGWAGKKEILPEKAIYLKAPKLKHITYMHKIQERFKPIKLEFIFRMIKTDFSRIIEPTYF